MAIRASGAGSRIRSRDASLAEGHAESHHVGPDRRLRRARANSRGHLRLLTFETTVHARADDVKETIVDPRTLTTRNSLNFESSAMPWYAQVTREQWRAFWAVFVGWVADAFDFNMLAFVLIDIQKSFTV
jgi:hypothetical protein